MSAIASLWRTGRPRFPAYLSDGRGRDYYIKYTNGGYWENQFKVKKKPDYERPRYSNFHTLFHQAAPFKYWGNGNGRETYVLQKNGLFREEKPLCAYKLSDFLRNNQVLKGKSLTQKSRLFMSLSERKYNDELRAVEKKLIKRLYTIPMRNKKQKKLKIGDGFYPGSSENWQVGGLEYYEPKTEMGMGKTYTTFPKMNINEGQEEKKDGKNENKIHKHLNIETSPELATQNFRNKIKDSDILKVCQTDYHRNQKNFIKFNEPEFNRTVNAPFHFKPKPKQMNTISGYEYKE